MEKNLFFRLFFWQQFLCRSFLMNLWLKYENKNFKGLKTLSLFLVNKKTSLFFKI
jgi:hypothetical protein